MIGTFQGIELWVSGSAARVLAGARLPGASDGTAPGRDALLLLLLVAGLGGLCAWGLSVRRHRIRRAALDEARRSLHLLIGTHTSALLTLHAIAADDEERARIEGAADSLILVDHLIGSLSEESLSSSAGKPRVTWSLARAQEAAPLLEFRRN